MEIIEPIKSDVLNQALLKPDFPGIEQTFSSWIEDKNDGYHPGTWRLQEFLGEDRPSRRYSGSENISQAVKDHKFEYLVIDDSDVGFRDNERLWRKILPEKPKAVIVKMSGPLTKGRLWPHLKHYADVLTVVLQVGELRQERSYVGTAFSWEQIYEDTIEAIRDNELREAARVIVRIGTLTASSTGSGPWRQL